MLSNGAIDETRTGRTHCSCCRDHERRGVDLVEVGQQRRTRAWVLQLDRDLAPVVPDGAVHLTDRRSRGRLVLELLEQITPVPQGRLAA